MTILNHFWFPYTIIFINVLIIWFMPKRLTKHEIYILWFVLAAITVFADLLFGAAIDLFDYGPNKQITVFELPVEALLPPSFGVIFLNFMPHKRRKFILYYILWISFTILFELTNVWVGFLNYKGWNIGFSTLIYFAIFLFIRWHYYFIRKRLKT